MTRPRAHILYFGGVNCHHETKFALQQAGADARILLLNRVLQKKDRLSDCDLHVLAGGFGHGDHIRSGVIAAIDIVRRPRLREEYERMIERGVPILGICNGFQDVAASGLLGGELGKPTILMDHNMVATFQHWMNTKVVLHHNPGCVWTEGLDGMEIRMPSAHGEGQPVNLRPDVSPEWAIAGTYGSYEGIATYPISPNGSHIAGIHHKNVTAFMPHPERNLREGILIFQAGVRAVM
jgi:phosphoribosylformylglycinamidine synthase